MALTKEERDARIKLNEMLDKYSNNIRDIFDDIVSISEGTSTGNKVSNLADLQKLMDENKDRLAFLGVNTFNESKNGDINVSILMLSTKTVKVPEDDNLITLAFKLSRDWESNAINGLTVGPGNNSAKLENFLEMPIKPDVENELSAKDLVRRCDASQFYKLYQEDALSIIRKLFPYPYGMFTGPHLYKREDKAAGTLYVAYDKFRKKFRYAYNPEFILESAIEEWMLNNRYYKSLKDCYCYLLAFMITHEMLHIIHHNTVSDTGIDESRLSTADHEVSNCVMDSFINCKIARRFSGAPQLRSSRGLAPMLSNGIGSKITVRIEHNKGLKKFETLKDMTESIASALLKDLRASDGKVTYYSTDYFTNRDLSKYEGADIFITVNINPTLSELRSNGSNLFQNCFNDIILSITDGKAHGMYSKISDEEKVSDLDILPVGTTVMVKGIRDIGIITSYNSDDNTYGVNKMDVKGATKIDTDEHGDIYVTEYEDSGKSLGIFSRIKLRPYNPKDDAYYDNAELEPKQDKLSPEDLQSLNQPNDQGNAPQQGGEDKPIKSFKVGDIVWVRKVKKFGKITSMGNGKFSIEEVIEKPCKVLDDSDNYN